mgnify:CR=1 FL=1|jgi:hypothetical protein
MGSPNLWTFTVFLYRVLYYPVFLPEEHETENIHGTIHGSMLILLSNCPHKLPGSCSKVILENLITVTFSNTPGISVTLFLF